MSRRWRKRGGRTIITRPTIFAFHWSWLTWVVGVLAPHGGMNVWVFYLGPLRLEYWPAVTAEDERPF